MSQDGVHQIQRSLDAVEMTTDYTNKSFLNKELCSMGHNIGM